MTSNPDMAKAYRRALKKVHPMVGWTNHFVDRLVERKVDERALLPELCKTLNDHLLEIVFDSVRQETATRIHVNGYVVAARYDEVCNQLVILSVFESKAGRKYINQSGETNV